MEENENKAIQVIGVTGNVDFQMSRWDAGSGLQNNIVLLKAGCSH